MADSGKCKWKLDHSFYVNEDPYNDKLESWGSMCCNEYNYYFLEDSVIYFKYCPYCGKEIWISKK